jgi:hypothetical protein
VFYPYNRGALLSACVVLYALTAGIAGYTSGSYYKMLGGTNWVSNVLLTSVLFCGPLLATFSFLNTVAIFYGSSAALPFGAHRTAPHRTAPLSSPACCCPRRAASAPSALCAGLGWALCRLRVQRVPCAWRAAPGPQSPLV